MFKKEAPLTDHRYFGCKSSNLRCNNKVRMYCYFAYTYDSNQFFTTLHNTSSNYPTYCTMQSTCLYSYSVTTLYLILLS